MRKLILTFLLVILLIPFSVNAESKYLYDVLKEEAESGELAKEYTEGHHDSFTEEPSKKIYHWYATNDTEANEILNKWNVIFGDFCWQMIRTTDTGGIKLLYNGPSNNGVCNNAGESQMIGISAFNNGSTLADVGYMIPDSSKRIIYNKEYATNESKFGKGVIYNNNTYTLIDVSTTYDNYHHYTCNTSSNTCSSVRYYYYSDFYIELNGEQNIDEVLENMLNSDDVNKNNSTIKIMIDNWYQNNLLEYTNKLEDTIFCNDRSIANLSESGWNPDGGEITTELRFKNYEANTDLICQNVTDQFSVGNQKAKLSYPIGLLMSPEANLLNNSNLLNVGRTWYWLSSPSDFYRYGTYSYIYNGNYGSVNGPPNYINNGGVRPVISLKKYIKYTSGNGSQENPFVVDLVDYYSVSVLSQNDIVDIDFEVYDMNNIEAGKKIMFRVTPSVGYEIEKIEILDSEGNKTEYQKTDKENEYSFIMPASDVIIKPLFRKIESPNKNEKLTNPNTVVNNYILIMISILIISGCLYILLVKNKKFILK